MIIKTLNPYRQQFNEVNDNTDIVNDNHEISNNRSKYFYQKLCLQKFEAPHQEKKWEICFPDHTFEWSSLYVMHLNKIPDKI